MPTTAPKRYNVTAVIVTYGNRSHLATATICGAFKCGVSKVILVSNGKTTPVDRKEIGLDRCKNIQAIDCPINIGSAGGFNIGIQAATKDDRSDFIWLLDDDNMPDPEALAKLVEWHDRLTKDKVGANSAIALFSFRKERKWQRNILAGTPIDECLPPNNSCYGFHINELSKIFKNGDCAKVYNAIPYASIPYGPYGGFFATSKLLKTFPLPNRDLVLYFDDIEYSMRLAANGVRLYLIQDSVIADLEPSWDNKHRSQMIFTKILREKDTFRVFFGVRNCLYIESRRKSPNKFIFCLNIAIFSSLLILLSLVIAKPKRAILILGAMKDGLSGNLKRHTLDSQDHER